MQYSDYVGRHPCQCDKSRPETHGNSIERYQSHQISWLRLFHARPETYRTAHAVIANIHVCHPHAQLWGVSGKRFAPRQRDLKNREFHTFEIPDAYPALRDHIGTVINIDLILEYWGELLPFIASIGTKTVAPSTILKKLAASPNPSQLSKTLCEFERLERTLFMIE